jgi:hypothetical protein
MRRRVGLAGALVVAALAVVGVAAPAQAAEVTTPTIWCDINRADGRLEYRLTATATYEDDRAAGYRLWKRFRYRIYNSQTPTTDGNNVNIRLKEYDTVVWKWDSPDNRVSGQWYNLVLTNPAKTRLIPHDHRSKDLIEFRAIFDVPMAGDRSCTAWTKVSG